MSSKRRMKLLADETITLKDGKTSAPEVMRRVVEVDGEQREMVFLTN